MGYELFFKRENDCLIVVEFGFYNHTPLSFNVWVECNATDFGVIGDNIADLVIQTQSHYNKIFSQMNNYLNMSYADLGLNSNDFDGFQFVVDDCNKIPQIADKVYRMWCTTKDNLIENEEQLEKIKSKLEWKNYESFVG